MSISSKFNGLTTKEVTYFLGRQYYGSLLDGQKLINETALKNFECFFLSNSDFDLLESSRILSEVKLFYKDEKAVLKRIDEIAMVSVQRRAEIGSLSASAVRFYIENLGWHGQENENKRLGIVKKIFNIVEDEGIDRDIDDIFGEENIFDLSDRTKFELLKFMATRQSYLLRPDRIVDLFWQLHVPKSDFVELIDVIIQNFKNEIEIVFIANTRNFEQLLNLDPQFLSSLIDKFFRVLCESTALGIHQTIKFKTMLAPETVSQSIRDYPHLFITHWNEFPHLFDTLEKRCAFAGSCVEDYADVLAENLLFLFTEHEINDNRSFFDSLIEKCFEGIQDSQSKMYLGMISLYLDKLANRLTFEKDGSIWECIGEVKKHPGLWAFKAKWECDFTVDRPFNSTPHPFLPTFHSEFEQRDIFPAIETYPHDFIRTISEAETLFNQINIFCKSGPSGTYAIFPDAQSLMSAWKSLQEENRVLPNLSIAECDGVATSEQFMDLLEVNDFVYSRNKECAHDIEAHGVITVLAALENKTMGAGHYEGARDRLRSIKRESINIIKAARLQQISTEEQAMLNVFIEILGVLHDMVTARSSVVERHRLMEQWENNEFIPSRFVHGTGVSAQEWPYWQITLWKNIRLRPDLITLGMHDQMASGIPQGFPIERLNEYWKLIKSEFRSTLDQASVQAMSSQIL